MSLKVLVIGATGMVGRIVVQELTKAGIPVRALVRSEGKARRLLPPSVELLAGDCFREADIQRALAGSTHVYFHPAATTAASPLKSMDRVGTQLLLRHLPHGVHFIKLSEIGASHNPSFFDIDCKHLSEVDIREQARQWTILRPTWFMESIPELLTLGPASVCFGPQPRPLYWLSGRDYAQTVVACVQKPALSSNQTFTLQGPEAHRLPDAIRLFNREARTGKLTLQLPLGLLTLPALLSDEYRFNQQIMRYYNSRHEPFESEAAHQLLHKPMITLAEFARQFRAVQLAGRAQG